MPGWIYLFHMLIVLLSACTRTGGGSNEDLMELASRALVNGNYRLAHDTYRRILDHPDDSPLKDDAAYRLAYISVIADERNPYLDYEKARRQFRQFVDEFPKSRYIMACNNWLKVLNLVVRQNTEQPATRTNQLSRTCEQQLQLLEKHIKQMREKNESLQKTLNRLRAAIER